MTACFPGPVVAEQAQFMTTPPYLTVGTGMRRFWWCAVSFWFSPKMALCLMTKHLNLDLFSPKDIVPDLLWFVQIRFCKPKSCCHNLFGKSFSLSPFHESCTCSVLFRLCHHEHFSTLTEACKTHDVALGFFLYISWALNRPTLDLISWNAHSWEDLAISWRCSICK